MLLVVLLAVPGALAPALQDPADAARQRVERTIDAWRAREPRAPDELVEALVELGAEAVPVLGELLDERPPELPVEPVARALGRSGGAAALRPLERLLGARDAAGRVAAVDGLAAHPSQEACSLLLEAHADEDAVVRERAEEALLHARLPAARLARAVELRAATPFDPVALALLLGRKRAPETHGVLLDLVGDWRAEVQLGALQGLQLDPRPGDAEPVLALLDRTTSRAVEKQACLVLGKVGDPLAVRALIDLLHGDDRGVVANAHWALQRITGLRIGPDVELWEAWWERSGSRRGSPPA